MDFKKLFLVFLLLFASNFLFSKNLIEFDSVGNCISLEEKPLNPKSNKAVVGLYFYPNSVIQVAKQIQPSTRGELEITDAIQWMIDENHAIEHRTLKGWWIDTGKKDPLLLCNELILEKIESLFLSQTGETVTLNGEIVVG